MREKTLLLFVVTLAINLHGQQVGEIDLVRHQSDSTERDDVVPSGCDFPHYTNSDGVIVDTGKKPKLRVELVLSKNVFERRDTVEGKVVMQNIGPTAIAIPWSLDPRVGKRPKEVIQNEYEMGWFELELKGFGKVSVPLESGSESSPLYSSPSNPLTRLSIEPGQTVVIKLKFRLEEKRKLSALVEIKPGKAEIGAKWRQANFTWRRDGCAVQTGYFSYDYQEDVKPASVEISN